jgi:hypothetical protein
MNAGITHVTVFENLGGDARSEFKSIITITILATKNSKINCHRAVNSLSAFQERATNPRNILTIIHITHIRISCMAYPSFLPFGVREAPTRRQKGLLFVSLAPYSPGHYLSGHHTE